VVPPVQDWDFFISTGRRVPALRSWPSAFEAEAHAGIAFDPPYFGYNKRQKLKSR
jgi:hypothetical protein